MRHFIPLTFVALVAASLGCASTPEEPEVPVGIEVTPMTEGRYYGGRAIYAVKAPISRAERLLLDFSSQADFRPTIREAELVSESEGGGTVRFKFKAGGFEPVATCRFTVDRDEDTGVVVIRYEMIDPGLTIWGLRGGFELRPVKMGAGTIVNQHFLVSAVMMNRESFLSELRRDAEAIRRKLEAGREAEGEAKPAPAEAKEEE